MRKNRTLDKDRKDFLHRELKEYEAATGIMTAVERKELHKWVAVGNSVHENPYYIYGEDGHPMDYITAIRFNEDLCEEMRNLAPEQLVEFEREAYEKDMADSLTGGTIDDLIF